ARAALTGAPGCGGSSWPSGGQARNLTTLLQSSVGDEEPAAVRQRPPQEGTVLLFPGQGSQFVGMGWELLHYPNIRDMFRVAEKVLGYDLLSLCLQGPPAKLDRTLHCHPAVFVASLAAVEKLHHQHPSVSGWGCWGGHRAGARKFRLGRETSLHRPCL
uniref:Malonyl-CoA:ACP transacylase (MAT) domain-containing protein n=1 Tax=Chelydra serpentina TaxID=8475 RepID=A0A8C3SQY0_CHESE